ncbi:hypothetical protein AVEN_214188-1 [Araneus ventricosus]|uniref:Fibrinogen C-terminal domain-containing protein n=1 Tax=Araneus ventricosus TaxID=182803 RepID=A0A4Y2FW86_ARAVE|nr:hypothetical protein AVEN_214188-1 [Araneus ventricosus]
MCTLTAFELNGANQLICRLDRKRFYIFCACVFSFLAIIYAAGHKKSDCLEKEKALALLETAEDLLTKAGDSFPTCKGNVNSTDQSDCGSEKPLAYVIISKKLISEVREHFPACPQVIVEDIKKIEKPSDCSEILASGHNKSGNYTIWPGEKSKTRKPLKVYCDMETDGGGWTGPQPGGGPALGPGLQAPETDSTEDPPCMGPCCMPNHTQWPKRPPAGVRKL